MSIETADHGEDPRGAPDPMPMWSIFNMTPEGGHPEWRPKLLMPTMSFFGIQEDGS
jgi:predicted dithiol-disulfide oxidoreductase (DUF899 family)